MEIGVCDSGVQIAQKVEVSGKAPVAKVTVEWQTCSEGSCLPPTDDVLTIKLPAGTGAAASVSSDEVAPVKKESGKSIWAVILEAIAWGFVALLTPCVFPMVPMTVSFFLKSKDGKGKFYASMYGFFIVALYTVPIAVIILLTYILGGDAVTADIFNWLATHWIPNILFFIIFMVFAASFFGQRTRTFLLRFSYYFTTARAVKVLPRPTLSAKMQPLYFSSLLMIARTASLWKS